LYWEACWDFPLEKEYIILGLGVDINPESPDNILVSFIGPSQTNKGNTVSNDGSGSSQSQEISFHVFSSGEGIRSAVTKAQNKSSRELSINNLRVIVFSEDIARMGISKYLDPFLRNAQINPNAQVFVTQGTARNLLSYPGGSRYQGNGCDKIGG
jgi:spore germination protein KC